MYKTTTQPRFHRKGSYTAQRSPCPWIFHIPVATLGGSIYEKHPIHFILISAGRRNRVTISRVSPKNMEIERLRAVAILLVLNAHSPYLRAVLPKWLLESWMGVDLFFVISGYVVSQSLLRTLPAFQLGVHWQTWFSSVKRPLFEFYARRFFRIIPAAGAWMAVYIGIAALFDEQISGHPRQLLIESLYVLSGLYNYINAYFHYFEVYYLGHYWSLTVEEHFYLILPWLLVFFPSKRGRIITVVASILIVICLLRPFIPLVGDHVSQWSFRFFTSHRRFDALLLGVLLGLLRLHAPHKTSPASLALRLIGMLITFAATLAIAAFPFFAPDPFCGNLGLTFTAMLGVLLVWLASLERGLVFEIPIVSSILEYIGSRSYSMYLAHIAILVIMLHNANHHGPIFPTWLLNSSMGGVALFMIFVSLTTLAAEVSYRWIEKPIIEYGKIKIARSSIYSRQSTSYETQASKVPGT